MKHRNLYLLNLDNQGGEKKAIQLTSDVTVWDFCLNRDGNKIAASVSPKNLIDHRYMFRKIHLLDLETKELTQLTNNPGKLGNYAFSPDGSKLVYNAALTRSDHQVSQVYVIDTKGGQAKNLTIPDFQGHVNWVGWQDDESVLYRSGEGVWSTLSSVSVEGGERDILLNAKRDGTIFSRIAQNQDNRFVMIGSTPAIPSDVYYWEPGEKMKRMTKVNPWLEEKNLESAELNFKRTQELFNLGQVTTTQFREAQLNLISARNNISSAKYTAKLLEIELMRLSGQLLS